MILGGPFANRDAPDERAKFSLAPFYSWVLFQLYSTSLVLSGGFWLLLLSALRQGSLTSLRTCPLHEQFYNSSNGPFLLSNLLLARTVLPFPYSLSRSIQQFLVCYLLERSVPSRTRFHVLFYSFWSFPSHSHFRFSLSLDDSYTFISPRIPCSNSKG